MPLLCQPGTRGGAGETEGNLPGDQTLLDDAASVVLESICALLASMQFGRRCISDSSVRMDLLLSLRNILSPEVVAGAIFLVR